MKPTREQLLQSVGKTMPDVIAPNLRVLFCGINPSVYSVVVGHHFARPGNRFWKALHGGGWTPQVLAPHQDQQLLDYKLGITNVARPATVAAADLPPEAYIVGAKELESRVQNFAPKWLCVLGVSAYRVAFAEPKAVLGLQNRAIGTTKIWVLPNPSGLNAHYPPRELARLFGEFREVVEAE
jgi:TDG/mug DNA glycosylase family protein